MATGTARRYARAILEVAQRDGDVAGWGRRVAAVKDLLADPTVEAVVTNPTLPAGVRMDLVASVSTLDPLAANLARLLIEANHVRDIDGIADEYERLADEAAGRVRATVTTAIALTRSEVDRMGARLSGRLGREVKVDAVVDPRILGGMKLQFGDRLVDATVATKLQQLRRRLAAS